MTLVGDAQLSGDASRIAFVRKQADKGKDEYKSNIWLFRDGTVQQYSSGGKDAYPRWSPDGANLAFLSKRDKKMQIYILPTSGGEAYPITSDTIDVSGFVWAPDSRRIAFVAGVLVNPPEESAEKEAESEGKNGKEAEKKAPTQLIDRAGFKADGTGFVFDKRQQIQVVYTDSKEVKQLTTGDYNAGSPAWSPDGRHIVFASNRNSRWDVEIDSQIWEIPAEGGEPRRITQERGSWSAPVYSPTGDEIAFAGFRIFDDNSASGFHELWSVDSQGNGLRNLLEGHDIEVGNSIINDAKAESEQSLIWNEAGIWFVVSEKGEANIFRWRGELEPVTHGKHDIQQFSVAGDSVAYIGSDITHPAEVFRRAPSGETGRVTSFNDNWLSERELICPEAVTFTGAVGDAISGWLMKPLDDGSRTTRPVVLYIHGGPQAAYGWSFFHEMQWLAGKGIGVLLINPHGSSSYGEEHETHIYGAWGKDDFQDVMAAADFVSSLDWVDSARVGIAGGSYGGYMTSWAIGHTDRFPVAVVERALTNMLSFVGTTDSGPWWPYAWKTALEGDAAKLWSMSPIAYTNRMSTPTLVIHSENDHRCPVEQGEQLFVALRRRDVPTRFVRFPEESHGLSRGGKPSRRIERLGEIEAWLTRYL
jgi:acylaminoacyl-peptidase